MATAAAATPARRMALANVHRGKRPAPDRIVLIGTEGVGKSTFAAAAPNPVFIAAEDGVRHLDVASFPEPRSVADVYDALAELREGEHEFQTAVIDTIDWLEPLIFAEVCKRNRWENIEAPGYGKGYTVALDEWRKILADLDRLRNEREMEIILIGHCQIKTFANPIGPDYSRYELNVNKGSAALVKQWADAVLFATYEEFIKKDKKTDSKHKAVVTGKRVLHTTRVAAWDAKNRHNLPEVLPLDYSDYAAAREAEAPQSIEQLIFEFDALITQLAPAPAQAKAIQEFVGDRTDAGLLARACDRMRSLIDQKEGGQ